MTRDQKIVGIGAASGVAAMIVAIAGTYLRWPSSPRLVDISSRLAYAVQANAFAVIPLLAGIITVGLTLPAGADSLVVNMIVGGAGLLPPAAGGLSARGSLVAA